MSGSNVWDSFDKSLGLVIIHAQAASVDGGVDCIYAESLAIGILTTGANEVNSTLIKMDVDLDKALRGCKMELKAKAQANELKEINQESLRVARQVHEICKRAKKISDEAGLDKFSHIHLFVALLQTAKSVRDIFEKCGLNMNEVEDALLKKRVSTSSSSSKRKKLRSALGAFCTDVTALAESNKLDPIIAREKEIEMAITVLCRRGKNNPILLGEPGVGKTAIVEGISQRIVSGTVPKQLIGSRIFSLNLSSLVAGTKYRGDFEERIQALVKEVQSRTDCILFIDEIHTLVGAGSAAGGALDASNILKPFLARSDLRCIGATTLDDFKKYFQKDGALTRRFQQILVEEPTKEQMCKIMKGIKSRFEQFHNCVISEDAIDSIINLTGRYLPDKNFPDKAIDCMDMTCAKYAWFDPGNPRATSSNMRNVVISSHDVAQVVSEQCQIPIEVIMWDDNERISKIEDNLSKTVIGQKEAIDTVCRVLKNSYSGIRNPNRPIGCFVFGGQSGTGKTHMAKQLAHVVFGKENALVRLDMSEFSESHSVSKLVGSPPGYVGFQETDNLIDKIKRKPYSIVLLDELEKSSPEVIKLFLQVMSDGVMTDSVGNKVDFKNIILIMTGNFGMNEAAGTDLGFTAAAHKNATEQERDRLIRFCKERYGAEYVNRVDEFVPFMPLDQESLKEIAKIETAEIAERIASRKCRLNFTDNVYALLAKKSAEQYGQNASPLNRLIAKELEPCISDALLSIPSNKPYTITIDVKNNEFTYRKRQRKGTK